MLNNKIGLPGSLWRKARIGVEMGAPAVHLAHSSPTQPSLLEPSPQHPRPRSFFHRIFAVILLIVIPSLAICGSFAAVHWPYRYREIHPLLEDVFGYQVKVERYHRTYFPHPGFIAAGITLRSKRDPSQPPLGTVQTLSVVGRWRDLLLLQRRVRMVEMTRFHLTLPAPGNESVPSAAPHGRTDGFKGPVTLVDKILIHNSTLDILRANGGHYLRHSQPRGFRGAAEPRYELRRRHGESEARRPHFSKGSIGPINSDEVGPIPVSGQFTFNQVKLSDIGELRGTLASSGYFQGPLRAIQAEAISDAPDFAVAGGHPTHIRGFVRCTVDGVNGDVYLSEVRSSSGNTVVTAHGQVAGSPKITNLDFEVVNGRAEDVLHPFIHDQVPVLGPVTLRGSVFVAAPGKPFLQRLRVNGRLDLPAGKLSNPAHERSFSDFSHRMEEHKAGRDQPDPPHDVSADVLADLQGPVSIRMGIVSTPDLLFRVPGAHAALHGTFNLEDETAHLTGTLKMDATISHATTGWKSIVLTPLQPFFRRKFKPGSEIPIAVTGSPGKYKVTQDISQNK